MTTPTNANDTYKQQINTINAITNVVNYGAKGDSGTTDNLSIIQARVDAANTAGGGTVRLPMDSSGGQYNIDSGLDLKANVRLEMDPGVIIMSTDSTAGTDRYVVDVYPGAQIFGGQIAVDNNTFTGSLIRLDGGNGPFDKRHGTRIDSVILDGVLAAASTIGACVGVHLYAGAQGEYVEWCSISNITIDNVATGIRLEAEGVGSTPTVSFINGNQFTNISADHAGYCVQFAASGDADIHGNQFANIQMQTKSDTLRFIKITGDDNHFVNTKLWDWANSSETIAIDFTLPGGGNAVYGAGFVTANIGTGNGLRYNSWGNPGITVGGTKTSSTSIMAGYPAASYTGHIMYVTDGDGGNKCLAVSDGTNWLRIALGAAISAT